MTKRQVRFLIRGTSLIVAVLAGFYWGGGLSFQHDKAAYVTSSIVFDAAHHNFGDARPGAKLEHSFKFRNISQHRIKILRVSTTCGCIAERSKRSEVAPGADEEIRISLRTDDLVPPQHVTKEVLVYFDDNKTKAYALHIEVNLKPSVSLDPGVLAFSIAPGARTSTATLTVRREMLDIGIFKAGNIHNLPPYLSVKKIQETDNNSVYFFTLDVEKAPANLESQRLFYKSAGLEELVTVPLQRRVEFGIALNPVSYHQIIDRKDNTENLKVLASQNFQLKQSGDDLKVERIELKEGSVFSGQIIDEKNFSITISRKPPQRLIAEQINVICTQTSSGLRLSLPLEAILIAKGED